jgi:hypothetical protein
MLEVEKESFADFRSEGAKIAEREENGSEKGVVGQ